MPCAPAGAAARYRPLRGGLICHLAALQTRSVAQLGDHRGL